MGRINRRWTDTGSAHGERGLKHRAAEEARHVPMPPELVAILRGKQTGLDSWCMGEFPRESGY